MWKCFCHHRSQFRSQAVLCFLFISIRTAEFLQQYLTEGLLPASRWLSSGESELPADKVPASLMTVLNTMQSGCGWRRPSGQLWCTEVRGEGAELCGNCQRGVWARQQGERLLTCVCPYCMSQAGSRGEACIMLHPPAVSSLAGETCVCMHAKSLQLCPTLWDLVDCSPPGSSVRGILQARNTGVGCHALLLGIFPAQGSNPCLLRLLHWQVYSLLLSHQDSPKPLVIGPNQWLQNTTRKVVVL